MYKQIFPFPDRKFAEKPWIYKNAIIFFGFPGHFKHFIFFIFDPSDIWVNRIQKLGGRDFFPIRFGSLKGCLTCVSKYINSDVLKDQELTVGHSHYVL